MLCAARGVRVCAWGGVTLPCSLWAVAVGWALLGGVRTRTAPSETHFAQELVEPLRSCHCVSTRRTLANKCANSSPVSPARAMGDPFTGGNELITTRDESRITIEGAALSVKNFDDFLKLSSTEISWYQWVRISASFLCNVPVSPTLHCFRTRVSPHTLIGTVAVADFIRCRDAQLRTSRFRVKRRDIKFNSQVLDVREFDESLLRSGKRFQWTRRANGS
jgi:hypothetical protein